MIEKQLKQFYIDGIPRINCLKTGEGPPIIFLHGIGGNSSNWIEQQVYFSELFTTFSWDARGYGKSDDYKGALKFSDFSHDLLRLLDHLSINKAHLVGLSMGARILMDFYSKYSNRVATLTLCDCFYNYKTFLSPIQKNEYLDIRQKPLLEGKSFEELAPKIIKSLVGPNCLNSVKEKVFDSLKIIHVKSYLKTIRESINYDVSKSLSNIDIPVQLIFGEYDTLTPPAIGYSIKKMINNAELDIIDNAGHLTNMEQPDAFNEVLIKFLLQYQYMASFYE